MEGRDVVVVVVVVVDVVVVVVVGDTICSRVLVPKLKSSCSSFLHLIVGCDVLMYCYTE